MMLISLERLSELNAKADCPWFIGTVSLYYFPLSWREVVKAIKNAAPSNEVSLVAPMFLLE
jgi:hypothetical protein